MLLHVWIWQFIKTAMVNNSNQDISNNELHRRYLSESVMSYLGSTKYKTLEMLRQKDCNCSLLSQPLQIADKNPCRENEVKFEKLKNKHTKLTQEFIDMGNAFMEINGVYKNINMEKEDDLKNLYEDLKMLGEIYEGLLEIYDAVLFDFNNNTLIEKSRLNEQNEKLLHAKLFSTNAYFSFEMLFWKFFRNDDMANLEKSINEKENINAQCKGACRNGHKLNDFCNFAEWKRSNFSRTIREWQQLCERHKKKDDD